MLNLEGGMFCVTVEYETLNVPHEINILGSINQVIDELVFLKLLN